MKKTALLLFDLFSNYEISVALSILAQAGKKFDVFCIKEEAVSEEGVCVKRDKNLSELSVLEYDSLLIPGGMDLRDIIDDERIHDFIRSFDLSEHVIASISSSPLLLFKAGILDGKKYVAGVDKEGLLEEGFTMEQMMNMRDINELKNDDGSITSCLADGNLLTAVGFDFVNFGIEFGKMLKLEFEPAWYR